MALSLEKVVKPCHRLSFSSKTVFANCLNYSLYGAIQYYKDVCGPYKTHRWAEG